MSIAEMFLHCWGTVQQFLLKEDSNYFPEGDSHPGSVCVNEVSV